mgnify:CR=1 FL=1
MNKAELINLTKSLLNEVDLSKRKDDLLYLKKQYKYFSSKDEDSFYEQQQTKAFVDLYLELAKKEPKLIQSPYEEKKEIIELAKSLLLENNIQKAYFDNLFIKEGIAFETYKTSTTILFDETIPSISTSTKHLIFYTQTTTAFLFALVAKDDGTRTSAKVTITIGDGNNITVTNVNAQGWTIIKKDNYYIVDILISAIGINSDLPTGKINFRDLLPVTVAKLHLE